MKYLTGTMSHIHRLRTADRIFFVTVNLRRSVQAFDTTEYQMMTDVLEGSRARLEFLLCGYVLMPDHWHALIWTAYPPTISQVVHDVKKVAARRLHQQRGTDGAVWQHQFWDRFVRHEKEFGARLDYMHLNPVRKGFVGKPEEW
ncbi:MAG: transposase [Acidobacteria bacterium]|nr:transposase [Acidobacteriota bacterium]